MAKLVVGVFRVSEEHMRQLSRSFAKKDETPYVLSFKYDQPLTDNKVLLGDILVRSTDEYDDDEIIRWLEHGFRNLWEQPESNSQSAINNQQ